MSDYIKKEDAKKWLTNLREDCGRYQDMWHYAEALDQIIELLSVDVAPVRHGRWIEHYKSDAPPTLKDRWICSWCGNVQTYGATDYCPNCGARMDGEEKNCDTCKHYDKEWDDIICDGCTKAHSNWERRTDE